MSSEIEYRGRIYEKYASTFQDRPQTFDEEASHRWGSAYDTYLSGWLPSGKTADIVDIACGAGTLLHFFKHRGYSNIRGVDCSAEQVRIARQVVPVVAEENGIVFLDRHKECFDLITGFDIIEHFNKPEALHFLDVAYAALKPGGRLILQTPNGASPFFGSIRYGDFTHEVCFTSDSLSRLMKLAGFTDIQARGLAPQRWGRSVASTLRWGVWQAIRLVLIVWSLAETGSRGSGIFTRVFIITGIKQ
jgi:2-polyprenyl-3-methyl-5-hydroxy-6-metoxy-1,4-benzoquinol methylase